MRELWSFRTAVFDFLRRSGVSRDDAEDMLSLVFMVAWRRLADVPTGRDAAVSWLCGVARLMLRNHRRAMYRHMRLVDRAMSRVRDGAGHSGGADAAWRVLAVEAWLSLSPGEQRVLLDAAAGYALDDLARALGCTRLAAAKRLSRARRRLTEAFGESTSATSGH